MFHLRVYPDYNASVRLAHHVTHRISHSTCYRYRLLGHSTHDGQGRRETVKRSAAAGDNSIPEKLEQQDSPWLASAVSSCAQLSVGAGLPWRQFAPPTCFSRSIASNDHIIRGRGSSTLIALLSGSCGSRACIGGCKSSSLQGSTGSHAQLHVVPSPGSKRRIPRRVLWGSCILPEVSVHLLTRAHL